MLRASSSILSQKVLAAVQVLVVDQRLPNLREVHRSNARVQEGNGVSTCSQYDEIGVRVFQKLNDFAVSSDSAMTRPPNKSNSKVASCY